MSATDDSAKRDSREIPLSALDEPGEYIANNVEDFKALADRLEDGHPGLAAVIRRAVDHESGGDE